MPSFCLERMSLQEENLKNFKMEILSHPRISYSVQLKLYDILIPILCGTIIGLNLVIVFSSGLILKKRAPPRSTYLFLGNIALADMLTGIATVFGQYYPKTERSELMCCLQIGLIISPTLASIYTIFLIAVDRYLYILNGLQYQFYLSTKRARLLVACTWILGCLIGFLPAMGWRNSTDGGRLCWLIVLEPTILLLITVTIGVIPLFLIIILYGIILKRALRTITELRNSEQCAAFKKEPACSGLRFFRGGNADNSKTSSEMERNTRCTRVQGICYIGQDNVDDLLESKRTIFSCCRSHSSIKISTVYSPSRWKAIKIVVFTTGCYLITWFPYFLACALYVVCEQRDGLLNCNALRVAIASPLAILGLSNSLMNPVIYAWWHNGFRESTKKIYHDMWKLRIKPRIVFLKSNE